MKMKKLTTLALTSALALGALGIGSMSDLPIPGMQAQSADAAVMADVQYAQISLEYNTPNAIKSYNYVGGDGVAMLDFKTKHTARFTIKNSVGTVVKTGSFNPWVQNFEPNQFEDYAFDSETNISLTGLPKNGNHYRVDLILPMDDNSSWHSTVDQSWSQAFTYNADGSVTNIRR